MIFIRTGLYSVHSIILYGAPLLKPLVRTCQSHKCITVSEALWDPWMEGAVDMQRTIITCFILSVVILITFFQAHCGLNYWQMNRCTWGVTMKSSSKMGTPLICGWDGVHLNAVDWPRDRDRHPWRQSWGSVWGGGAFSKLASSLRGAGSSSHGLSLIHGFC